MEDILVQKLRYTEVKKYKNYSYIGDKDKKNQYNKNVYKCFSLRNLPDKNKCYFHSGKDNGRGEYENETYVTLVSHQKKSLYTNDDQKIKQYFNDPFTELNVCYYERTIKKVGDIIKCKLFVFTKVRDVNGRFFKKTKITCGFNYNTKTGNFFTYSIDGRTFIRQNSFSQLIAVLSGLLVKRFDDDIINRENYDTDEFKNSLLSLFNDEKTENLNGIHFLDFFMEIFTKKFIKIKKIKVPNNYSNLFKWFYPTDKYLKKNDRKLIASVLDMCGIKCDFLIKKYHMNPDFDFIEMIKCKYLFGDNYVKYISNLHDFWFTKKFVINNPTKGYVYERLKTYSEAPITLSDKEKENVIKILNSPKPEHTYFGVDDIIDHFIMLKNLREYDVDVKPLSSTNWGNFSLEHSNVSKLLRQIKKGYTTELVFNKEMVEIIETPIIQDGEVYEPFILKKENDYLSEGDYMHHCVGGYSSNTRSIIVSLRKQNSKDRVTSEYNIKSGKCQQSKYFNNAQPPEDFIKPLIILNDRISNSVKNGTLKVPEMVHTPIGNRVIEDPVKLEEQLVNVDMEDFFFQL